MANKKIMVFSCLLFFVLVSAIFCAAVEQDRQGVYVTAEIKESGVDKTSPAGLQGAASRESYVMHTINLKNYNHDKFNGDIMVTVALTIESTGKTFTKTITTTHQEYLDWKSVQDLNPPKSDKPSQANDFDRVNLIKAMELEPELGIYQISTSKTNGVSFDQSIKGKAKLLITYTAGDKTGKVLEQEITIGDRWFGPGVTIRGGPDAEVINVTVYPVTILGNSFPSPEAVNINPAKYKNLPPDFIEMIQKEYSNPNRYPIGVDMLVTFKNNGDKPLKNLEYDVEIPEAGYNYSFRGSFWKNSWKSIISLFAPKATASMYIINEGEKYTVNLNLPAKKELFKTPGMYTLKITLDPENKIIEPNEQNNVYTTQFRVRDLNEMLSDENSRLAK